MTDSTPPKTEEFTPEQRQLLGKAYRLILSWKREKPKPVENSSQSDKGTDTEKSALPPSVDADFLSPNKSG